MVKSNNQSEKEPKISKKRNLPKLSVIIPVYNADRYLEKCLNSVISQTLKNLEIICIDDCSDDNSSKILRNFEKAGIKVITSDRQQGQAHARNLGIDIAEGEYIGFVDADDYADITMFEKMYKKAKKEKADIEICEAVMYDDREKKLVYDDYFSLKCFPENFENKVFSAEDTIDFIENINVTLWNKIYKTSFLKENKIKFSEGYIYEDMPFIYEVYTKADKIGILREALYYYRVNTQNSTMTKNDKKVLDRVDMVEKSLEIFKNLPYFEKIRGKILNWAIHDIYYRYTLIDSKYQKEYFFKMQNLFKNIDVKGVEDSLLLDPYYPYFCEIPKRNYDESVKYFANKDTFYDPYIDSVKNMKAEYDYRLEQKAEEIYKAVKEEYDKLLDNTPLNDYHENFDTEKNEICKNYEKVIAELKEEYLKQQNKFDNEKQELCNSYDELQLKSENEKNEICDNYEKVITELKEDYLKQQNKFEREKKELCNSYDELQLKSENEKNEICDNYEKVITELKEDYLKQQNKFEREKKELCNSYDELQLKSENEKNEICDNYEKVITELKEDYLKQQNKFEREKKELCNSYDELQLKSENEKNEICDNYEKVIAELKEEYLKQQNKFEREKKELCNSYDELQLKSENEKNEICDNYEKVITELKEDYLKQQNKFEREKKELCNSYDELQLKSENEKNEICKNYEKDIAELKTYTDSMQIKFYSEKKELCNSYDELQNKYDTETNEMNKKYEKVTSELKEQQKRYELEKKELCKMYEGIINNLKTDYNNKQNKFEYEKQKICDNYDKILEEMKEEMILQRKNCVDMLKEQLAIGQGNFNKIKSFSTRNSNEGK